MLGPVCKIINGDFVSLVLASTRNTLAESTYSQWKRLPLNDQLTSQTKDIDRGEEDQVS